MNLLSWEKRRELKRLMAAGVSIRKIAMVVGCSRATVSTYKQIWCFSTVCGCGQPSGHHGWCHVRLALSPQRRGWLVDHWKKRSDSHLSIAVDRAYRESSALGHVLGPFVWGSAATTTLAYALCGICGQSVRLHDVSGRWDTLDGTAIRRRCLSAEQLAARRAASEEKQQWRKAKRTLVDIRRHLRPRASRTTESLPVQTSRA